MNDYLRERIKDLKRYQSISYKEIAEYLEMDYNTFHHWLKGYFNLKQYNLDRLNSIVCCLKE